MKKLILLVCLACAARAEEPKTINGITEPYRHLTLKAGGKATPPWTSQIARVRVEEGDSVEAGQVLIEFEKIEDELSVKLHRLLAGNRAELRGAEQKEKLLGHILEASRLLRERTKAISLEDIEKKQIEYETTVAERQRLEMVRDREQIELAQAEAALAKRTLKAPIRGTIVKLNMREGESCEGNDPLIELVDVSKAIFTGTTEEKVGRGLARGQQVELKVQTGASFITKAGKIIFVSPVADPASGLLRVKAEFENADGQVRPGVPASILVRGP